MEKDVLYAAVIVASAQAGLVWSLCRVALTTSDAQTASMMSFSIGLLVVAELRLALWAIEKAKVSK